VTYTIVNADGACAAGSSPNVIVDEDAFGGVTGQALGSVGEGGGSLSLSCGGNPGQGSAGTIGSAEGLVSDSSV
jgi:hypothetical protein